IAACLTLDYAHSREIIHRDLKPKNIMIGRYGETMVVDWGLAKPISQVENPVSNGLALGPIRTEGGSARTQMGSRFGTPQYMSPEQAEGLPTGIGVPSDVYSLGSTLYCILTGQAPV